MSRPSPVHVAERGSRFSNVLRTTDHKLIGLMYLVTSFIWFVAAGVMALLMRGELARPGLQYLSPEQYNQLFTMHGTIMLLFFATPIVFAFANYIVPLQIGAPDVSFPRLNALAYWLYLFGGSIAVAGFLTPATALTTLNGGQGVQLNTDGLADLLVQLRDGSSFQVTLDGAASVGDVLSAINNAAGDQVVPQGRPKPTGFQKVVPHIDDQERQAMCWELIGERGGGNGRHVRPPHMLGRPLLCRHMVPNGGHIRGLDRCLIDNLTITHHQDAVGQDQQLV